MWLSSSAPSCHSDWLRRWSTVKWHSTLRGQSQSTLICLWKATSCLARFQKLRSDVKMLSGQNLRITIELFSSIRHGFSLLQFLQGHRSLQIANYYQAVLGEPLGPAIKQTNLLLESAREQFSPIQIALKSCKPSLDFRNENQYIAPSSEKVLHAGDKIFHHPSHKQSYALLKEILFDHFYQVVFIF